MIYERLYSWQKQIIDKFKSRDAFGLFLDMGLGKTPLSLAFAEQNKCTKVIVITINSKATEDEHIDGSWLNWSSKSDISYVFHTKMSKNDEYSTSQNDLLLINYESLFVRGKDKRQRITLRQNVIDFISSCKGHNVALIVDESHKMKNLSSLQTGAIMQIKKYLEVKARQVYTYLLTGTPFTVGYIDLYTQLKMLGYEETKTTFIDLFCVRGNIPGLLGWQQPIVGYKNVDMLFRLIHRYAITIKSDEVVDLPDKIFINHSLPESKVFSMFVQERIKGKDILDELKRRKVDLTPYNTEHKVNNPFFRNIAYPDLKWLAETNGTFWMRARQLSIGFQGNAEISEWFDKSRLNALSSFLELNEDNYVIFYNFTPELLELYEICTNLGYNVDVFCGEMKSTYFYETYSKLDESKKLINKKNVILANYASGSTGMNWQEYSKCILFSIPLYKDYEQGLKRIHRLGQKSTVFYHVFYQKNWLDYSMKKALEEGTNYSLEMFESDLERIKEILTDDSKK